MNTLDVTPTRLGDTDSYRYVGSAQCGYLKKGIIDVLESVAASVIRDIPETKPFVMGNACPLTGRCPGNESHCTLSEVDFDYPTYSGIGTQYGGWEHIWIDNNPASMKLDESKVNWKALWQFILRLKGHCKTDSNGLMDKQLNQIVIHEKIFDLIAKNIDYTSASILNSIVTQDSGINANHHTHMHLKIALK